MAVSFHLDGGEWRRGGGGAVVPGTPAALAARSADPSRCSGARDDSWLMCGRLTTSGGFSPLRREPTAVVHFHLLFLLSTVWSRARRLAWHGGRRRIPTHPPTSRAASKHRGWAGVVGGHRRAHSPRAVPPPLFLLVIFYTVCVVEQRTQGSKHCDCWQADNGMAARALLTSAATKARQLRTPARSCNRQRRRCCSVINNKKSHQTTRRPACKSH
jgi:hypothetical protein